MYVIHDCWIQSGFQGWLCNGLLFGVYGSIDPVYLDDGVLCLVEQ